MIFGTTSPHTQHKKAIRIAFGGYARSGKDTAGKYLADRYGVTSTSFAEDVYRCASAVNSVLGRPDVKDRSLLRAIGEWGRNQPDGGLWLERTRARIQREMNGCVVTDVRFPDEAECLRKMCFTLVRIIRPGTDALDDHPSETEGEQIHWDVILMNDGTIAELEKKVDGLVFDVSRKRT